MFIILIFKFNLFRKFNLVKENKMFVYNGFVYLESMMEIKTINSLYLFIIEADFHLMNV